MLTQLSNAPATTAATNTLSFSPYLKMSGLGAIRAIKSSKEPNSQKKRVATEEETALFKTMLNENSIIPQDSMDIHDKISWHKDGLRVTATFITKTLQVKRMPAVVLEKGTFSEQLAAAVTCIFKAFPHPKAKAWQKVVLFVNQLIIEIIDMIDQTDRDDPDQLASLKEYVNIKKKMQLYVASCVFEVSVIDVKTKKITMKKINPFITYLVSTSYYDTIDGTNNLEKFQRSIDFMFVPGSATHNLLKSGAAMTKESIMDVDLNNGGDLYGLD